MPHPTRVRFTRTWQFFLPGIGVLGLGVIGFVNLLDQATISGSIFLVLALIWALRILQTGVFLTPTEMIVVTTWGRRTIAREDITEITIRSREGHIAGELELSLDLLPLFDNLIIGVAGPSGSSAFLPGQAFGRWRTERVREQLTVWLGRPLTQPQSTSEPGGPSLPRRSDRRRRRR